MSIQFNPDVVLALAPHPDDIELGMGGTVKKLTENGTQVITLIFSLAEASLPSGFSKEDIKNECSAALQHLGVQDRDIHFLDFPVRRFSSFRQEVLEELIRFSRNINLDVVFCPSIHDTHQDHNVVASEAVRAFRKTTVLGYELPWNTKQFDSSLNISLESHHLMAKEESLRFYKSQANRPYFEPGLLRNHARMRATVAGVEYVEAFELIRMLLR